MVYSAGDEQMNDSGHAENLLFVGLDLDDVSAAHVFVIKPKRCCIVHVPIPVGGRRLTT